MISRDNLLKNWKDEFYIDKLLIINSITICFAINIIHLNSNIAKSFSLIS